MCNCLLIGILGKLSSSIAIERKSKKREKNILIFSTATFFLSVLRFILFLSLLNRMIYICIELIWCWLSVNERKKWFWRKSEKKCEIVQFHHFHHWWHGNMSHFIFFLIRLQFDCSILICIQMKKRRGSIFFVKGANLCNWWERRGEKRRQREK